MAAEEALALGRDIESRGFTTASAPDPPTRDRLGVSRSATLPKVPSLTGQNVASTDAATPVADADEFCRHWPPQS
jgi:hypothetical protein